MSASAIIHSHPDYPNGGYAIVEIVGAAAPGDTVKLTILDLFQERYLSASGWEATAQDFGPYPVESTAADRFRFAIGPEIVNQLEEFKSLRLDLAGLQTFVTWPGTVLRDPSAKPDGTIYAEEKPEGSLTDTIATPPPELPKETPAPPPPPPPPAPPVEEPAAPEPPAAPEEPEMPSLMEAPEEDSIDAILASGGPDTSGLLPGEEEEVTRDPILEVPPSRAAPRAPEQPPETPVAQPPDGQTPKPPQPPTPKPASMMPLVVLLLLLLGAAGGGWWWWQNQGPDQVAQVDPPADPPADPPTDPVDPPADPVDPPEDPVDPPEDPVDPPEDPVDPPEDPVDPPEDPVDPPVQVAMDCSIDAALATEGDMLLILSDFADAAEAGDCDVEIDADFALRAIEEAAEQGDASAMLAFGALYDAAVEQPLLETRLGLSLTDDPSLALGWYGQARDAGSPDAANAVAALCEATEGTTDIALEFAREDYCE